MRNLMTLDVHGDLFRPKVGALRVDKIDIRAPYDQTPVLHGASKVMNLPTDISDDGIFGINKMPLTYDQRIELGERVLDIEHLLVHGQDGLRHVERKLSLMNDVGRS